MIKIDFISKRFFCQ